MGECLNDLDQRFDMRFHKSVFWDNSKLGRHVRSHNRISPYRWFFEYASVVDALEHEEGKDNEWLMDRAKILTKGLKKNSTRVNKIPKKLLHRPKQDLQCMQERVEILKNYEAKLAAFLEQANNE
jgi:L-rhamnose isomerase